MQVRGLRQLVLGMVLCISVVGCSNNAKKHGKEGAYGASTHGAGEGSGFGEEGDLLSKRKIYFAYDRSEIRDGEYEIIRAHAEYLKKNPNIHVRIEGHTDEQGSREYNVALGERRAHAVSRALEHDGVSHHQISTVSYGKEKPEVTGRGEESYALNRRAVIVYEN